MKFPTERDEQHRFSGHLRHYHRTSRPRRTWEQWVEADGAKTQGASSSWLKRGIILLAVLILVGIMAGLIIELS